MDWEILKLEDKSRVDQALSKHPTNLSDYAFANLWMWHGLRRYEVAEIDDHLLLRFTENGESIYLYPIGELLCTSLISKLMEKDSKFKMRAIPERAVESIKDLQLTISPEPDRFDYIYEFDELLHLQGNGLQPKRNLVHQFEEAYKYTYSKITPDLLVQVIQMEVAWYKEHPDPTPSLEHEHEACLRALKDYQSLGLFGGVLLVEDRVIAYTFAEYINNQMLLVHVEKALHNYKGVYQTINQQLLMHTRPVRWINREEDLGVPNLAKGKQSYHPSHLEKKYAASLP